MKQKKTEGVKQSRWKVRLLKKHYDSPRPGGGAKEQCTLLTRTNLRDITLSYRTCDQGTCHKKGCRSLVKAHDLQRFLPLLHCPSLHHLSSSSSSFTFCSVLSSRINPRTKRVFVSECPCVFACVEISHLKQTGKERKCVSRESGRCAESVD